MKGSISCEQREVSFVCLFILFTIFLGSKTLVEKHNSGLCALSSKVTLFSYEYCKTGIVIIFMIFPLKHGSF